MSNDLVERYKYGAQYIDDYVEFRRQVLYKTIIPHQVEIQPPPPAKQICWLQCPWCYGLSAKDAGDRLPRERAIEIMHQIAKGGVKKVIFAGYATDPLYCRYLEDLLAIAIDNRQIFGFNTKAIKVSDRLLELLATPMVAPKSYMSVSVDAGSNRVYNEAHAVTNENAKLYDHVRDNVEKIAAARAKGGAWFDISATYLVNAHTKSKVEIASFVRDFRNAGANLLRFAFPQLPRDFVPANGIIPTADELRAYASEIRDLIDSESSEKCVVMLVDADTKHDIFRKPRTLPCFARFVYPTVGFDGWLYHCSQSSSPNFRPMALGNLLTHDFWDLYYDYDAGNLAQYFEGCAKKMNGAGCRCDRKEHVVNLGVRNSGVFQELDHLREGRTALPVP